MNAQIRPDIPPQVLQETLARLRAAHQRETPGYAQRIDDLKRLRAAFKARLESFASAVSADFGRRSRHETLLSDGMTTLHEIDHAVSRLRKWMRPRRVSVDASFLPARAQIRMQPLGVVGIISPWNYPINLALMPLAAAIAAGNHVMLKPSEHTPRTSELLKELLDEVFPADRVATVLGGSEVAVEFGTLAFDHLLFTGSTEVGRLVMAAAAKNLTPVTLELGGKSPAIVAPGYPVETAARRIAAGKFFNAGQTCIAPDYVLLPPAGIDAFVATLRACVAASYADSARSPDYTSIVNARQYARLARYLDDARDKGAKVLELGTGDETRRIFPPTVVLDARPGMLVLEEEIFGPILPLVAVPSVEAAIEYINARPRPLALYHFDHDGERCEQVLDRTISGGVTINDTTVHFGQAELPFGGIGPSGMGSYHGHAGFLTFSKQKPVMFQARWPSSDLIRPPYGKLVEFLIRILTR